MVVGTVLFVAGVAVALGPGPLGPAVGNETDATDPTRGAGGPSASGTSARTAGEGWPPIPSPAADLTDPATPDTADSPTPAGEPAPAERATLVDLRVDRQVLAAAHTRRVDPTRLLGGAHVRLGGGDPGDEPGAPTVPQEGGHPGAANTQLRAHRQRVAVLRTHGDRYGPWDAVRTLVEGHTVGIDDDADDGDRADAAPEPDESEQPFGGNNA